jgi:hypothetical protein
MIIIDEAQPGTVNFKIYYTPNVAYVSSRINTSSLHSELMIDDEQRLSSKERLRIMRRQEEQKQARQGNPGR